MDKSIIASEFSFKAVRSSGAGGQNVNKVETMVLAKWNIESSLFISEEEKALITEKLKNKINSEGFLQVNSQESRSQLDNKEKATEKLHQLVEKALVIPKSRKKTKPTKASNLKRLDHKKIQSEKKDNRRFRL